MQYTNLPASTNRVLTLIGYDEVNPQKEVYISELLDISKSLDLVPHYRPFIVAALILQQDLDGQAITEADGVKFTGLAKVIESLLGLQKSYDLSTGIEIPPGFSAQEAIDRLCDACGSNFVFSGMTV